MTVAVSGDCVIVLYHLIADSCVCGSMSTDIGSGDGPREAGVLCKTAGGVLSPNNVLTRDLIASKRAVTTSKLSSMNPVDW